MEHNPTDLYEHLIHGKPLDFTNFPLADPSFMTNQELLFKRYFKVYMKMKNPLIYRRYLNNIFNPPGIEKDHTHNMGILQEYLKESDQYVEDILSLIPAEYRKNLELMPKTKFTNDLFQLLETCFHSKDKREIYEAQRKLCLTKSFFVIDGTKNIKDGKKHMKFFDETLNNYLWLMDEKTQDKEFHYKTGKSGIKLVDKKEGDDISSFMFRSKKAQLHFNTTYYYNPIDIYHYKIRFKREYSSPHMLSRNVMDLFKEKSSSVNLVKRRRSSSILSKMIRKGIDSPVKINDILGVMFIVKERKDVYKLANILETLFSGPFSWNDVVDTISNTGDKKLLNKYTGKGYQVFKTALSILYPENILREDYYLFSTEFQIYTIEGYLRTIHSSHFASHRRLKTRQIIFGVLPYLFPKEIYGTSILQKILNDFIYRDHINTQQYLQNNK